MTYQRTDLTSIICFYSLTATQGTLPFSRSSSRTNPYHPGRVIQAAVYKLNLKLKRLSATLQKVMEDCKLFPGQDLCW